jgi:hypothetical protein
MGDEEDQETDEIKMNSIGRNELQRVEEKGIKPLGAIALHGEQTGV